MIDPSFSKTDSTLTVAGLSKVYRTAEGPVGGMHDTSFTLAPGTFFTLLGPSGCGKTTTLRSIAGLERPDHGVIRLGSLVFFDAEAGIDVPLNRRNIGMVFQSYAIWPHMTVFENVAFPLRVAKDRRYDRSEIRRMVGAALETVSLGHFHDRSATRLSGGQQQRIALARAIVRAPRLLLLDEPLSNLDASLREEMRIELKRLQQQIGVTTIYVTHDQSEALDMSDRIAVMNGGRVVQVGTPRDIYFRPASSFVAGFVGATNLMQGVVREAAVENDVVHVALADGQILRCLFPHAAPAGQQTTISVRPEALTVRLPDHQPYEGCNRMRGVVEASGFLGNMNRYGVRVGDTVVHANTGPQTVFPVGAQVEMTVPFEHTVAVPQE